MKVNFKNFGWQHFFFKVPDNWDLVEEHGNDLTGYLRLATLEKNTLELKWQKVSTKKNILDLVTEHAKKIGWQQNKIEKIGADGSVLTIKNIENNQNQQILFFAPKNKVNRLAIIRLFSDKKENYASIIKELTVSFKDEISEPITHWVFYECKYDVPSIYRKVKANIQAGNKELIVNDRHRSIYFWTISLVSHFCPYKPISYSNINLWIYDLLKTKFNKEISLSKTSFLENQITYLKTSIPGRLLFRNLFHFAHKWLIITKYHEKSDQLKITILNYRTDNELKKFNELLKLAD